MSKRSLFLLLCCILPFFLGAVSLGDVLPSVSPTRMESLVRGEYQRLVSVDKDFRTIIPKDTLIESHAKDMEATMEKGFSTALSMLTPYPDWWEGMSDEERLLKLFNLTLRTSTMAGAYYDGGKKKVVIFEDSSLLSSTDKKSRVPDRQFGELPEKFFCYALQKDTTYGSTVYSCSYTMSGDELFVTISNHDPFKVLGINVVASGNMTMCIDVKPLEEGLYLCVMATMMNKPPQLKVLGITVDIEDSIFQRVYALRGWFLSMLYSEG